MVITTAMSARSMSTRLELLVVFVFIVAPALAATKPSYIVYLGGRHSHGDDGGVISPEEAHRTAAESHYDLLGSVLGDREKARDAIFYLYTKNINGFAARLEAEEAAAVAERPGVVSVFPDRGRRMHTTRSWQFLGLERPDGSVPPWSPWEAARYGQNIIIGNLDSGVWPESLSFNDRELGPIPNYWKGACRNEHDKTFKCNSKLIGARYFNNGYAKVIGVPLNDTHKTPRDANGHGTHTLATAGGSAVRGAEAFGLGGGTARGGSPRARVAAYRVCYPPFNGSDACYDSDILAAFEAAIADGVHVMGKIVVCMRGGNPRVEKGEEVSRAGGAAMILVNDEASGNDVIADAHVLPAVHINHADGHALLAYINSTKGAKAFITRAKTVVGVKPAPVMAAFSSQGPNTVNPEILKPDVTAPGVSVIAAWSGAAGPTGLPYDQRRVAFNAQSGTSMSCPQVSGVAGLIKTLHPDWSPAAIKSAIMTTATELGNDMRPIMNSSMSPATPFSCGAGHVFPHRAMDPGLVYDLTVDDHLSFLCTIGYNATALALFNGAPFRCPDDPLDPLDFNYPSITAFDLAPAGPPATARRRVRNVGPPATYTAAVVREPEGVQVTVTPTTLTFESTGEVRTFWVKFAVRDPAPAANYAFGAIVWSDGNHQLDQEYSNSYQISYVYESSMSLTDKMRKLKELLHKSENRICADCSSPDPKWASANIGVFICLKCSGIHRSLGTHISKVLSVTLDEWTDDEINSMLEVGGNSYANAIYEAFLPGGYHKPHPDSSQEERADFIRSKYELQEFLKPSLRIVSNKSSLQAMDSRKDIGNASNSYSFKSEAGMVEFIGIIKVKVIRGTKLAVRDILSSDPYVVLTLGQQKAKTKVIKSNLNPVWNEVLTLSVPQKYGPLKLQVYDHDVLSRDDIMGEAEVDLQPMITAAMAFGDPGLLSDMQIGRWLMSRDNALARDSAVSVVGGRVKQEVSLRLQNVECGEVDLELEWIALNQ
ncbi:hypothetical protein OsJ_21940 [Oryza sativa Japonica Group]|uniref:Uncharacterized protein n=1 Tax=Oryza sativa subsp. japonica TaxID=39947 RepID=B9FU38_ORYSJ|nr:hypothetical protein OsJ_21940 [Oryza sativa Japonica Group]